MQKNADQDPNNAITNQTRHCQLILFYKDSLPSKIPKSGKYKMVSSIFIMNWLKGVEVGRCFDEQLDYIYILHQLFLIANTKNGNRLSQRSNN